MKTKNTFLIASLLVCAGSLGALSAFAANSSGTSENHGNGVSVTQDKPAASKNKITSYKNDKPKTETKDEKNNADEATGAISMDKGAEAKGTEKSDKPAGEHAEKTPGKSTKNTQPATTTGATFTADEALSALTEGNARWVSNQTTAPNTEPSRRADLAANGQKPFATVISCADSRVPLDRIFDRGVGEVFGVRVAGNIAGTSETGTIEYGLGHLNTPLLVVLSHTKCGAVKAAVQNADVHGSLAALVNQIKPAVERAKRNNPGVSEDQLIAATIKENVWQTVFDLLKKSPEIREKVTKGDVRVVGATYDIATGKVEFFGEHPWQNEIIGAMNATGTSETASADEPAKH